MKTRTPQWVLQDEELSRIFREKLGKNTSSTQWRNYFIKPWTTHLKLEFVTWSSMEEICGLLSMKVNKEDYDVVVGITTGGSFVGNVIARKLGLPFLNIRSKFWSEINFITNVRKTANFLFGVEQMPKIGEVPNVKGKRVLLIDDTTYTGVTLGGIKKVLLSEGMASNVATMVMWSKGHHKPDFFYSTKRIPIIWEWGAEID
jgi:hypoxanthine phosphoribosyltransferase